MTPERIAEIRSILSDYEKYHEHFCYPTREWVGCCAADCAETPAPPESRERTAIADLLAEVERLTSKPARVARWSKDGWSLRNERGHQIGWLCEMAGALCLWQCGLRYGGREASIEQARAALIRAAKRRGWEVQGE